MGPRDSETTYTEKLTAHEIQESVELVDPAHAKITIQVAAEAVERERLRQCLALAKDARVPGFRKGHVPRLVLEKYLGAVIKEAVQRELVAESVARVLRAHGLKPVGPFELRDVSIRWGQPLEFEVIVEVFPKITDVQFENLQVEVPRVVVSESDVDQALAALQERYATLLPVEDRDVVEAGDVVAVVTRPLHVARAKQEGQEQLLWVREDSENRSIAAQLVGRRVGDTIIVGNEQPQKRSAPGKGEFGRYAVRIERIYRRSVPSLDDEFAKTVGSVGTLKELRTQVAQELETRGKFRQETVLRQKLRQALVEANKQLVLPPSLVARELDRLARSYIVATGWRDSGAQEFLRQNPELLARLEEEARIRVGADLLLAAIAEREQIFVSEEEIDQAIERLATRGGYPAEAVRTAYRDAGSRAEVRQNLLLERALEKVRMTAQVREIAPDEECVIAAPTRNG